MADWFFREALVSRMRNDWSATLKNYQKVLALLPRESFYRQWFALDLMRADNFYKTNEAKVEVLVLAKQVIEIIPVNERSFEARAYLRANFTWEKEDFDLADNAYKNLSAISPYLAGIYNDWCQLKIYQKDWPGAFEKCEKALSLYPPLDHPHLNEQHRQRVIGEISQVWHKLASLNLEEKKYDQAKEYYRKIIKYQLFRPDIYKYLAEVYYLQENLDEAIRLNLHAYTLNPGDSALSYGLAILYKEKKDFAQAKFWAETALNLKPAGEEEIKEFIKKLK